MAECPKEDQWHMEFLGGQYRAILSLCWWHRQRDWLNNFSGDTKLTSASDRHSGRDDMQKDLGSLEDWSHKTSSKAIRQRTGTFLLMRKTGKISGCLPRGKEGSKESLLWPFNVIKETYKKDREGRFKIACSNTRGNGFKLKGL